MKYLAFFRNLLKISFSCSFPTQQLCSPQSRTIVSGVTLLFPAPWKSSTEPECLRRQLVALQQFLTSQNPWVCRQKNFVVGTDLLVFLPLLTASLVCTRQTPWQRGRWKKSSLSTLLILPHWKPRITEDKEVRTPTSHCVAYFRALFPTTFSHTLWSSCVSFWSCLQLYGCLCYTCQQTAILHAVSAKFCFLKSSIVPSRIWCSTSMSATRGFSFWNFSFYKNFLHYSCKSNQIKSDQIKSNQHK